MAENQANPGASKFAIQRIYLKDLSFESPSSPQVFRQPWQPEVDMNISTQSQHLEESLYEVVLKITVTVKQQDAVGFLVEVAQAGIFTLQDFDDAQKHHALGSFCPGILFPYARETVSNCSTRGGFPPLYLAPVNFDALYQEQLKKQGQQGKRSV